MYDRFSLKDKEYFPFFSSSDHDFTSKKEKVTVHIKISSKIIGKAIRDSSSTVKFMVSIEIIVKTFSFYSLKLLNGSIN